ncbi:hypothetical protein RDI58_029844 [Solanum bulbocastanum]|uniref:Uncharacterized protein n=1 Tax=Solanum bulbocastanum TaxID=147425 RepID=A0AAN8SSH6_SOLBU
MAVSENSLPEIITYLSLKSFEMAEYIDGTSIRSEAQSPASLCGLSENSSPCCVETLIIFLKIARCCIFFLCFVQDDCVDTSLMLVLFHSLTLFDEYMQQFKRGLFAPTPAGRPGKASICKSVYLQPWQCHFLFACFYTAKSEPSSLWKACDYLKWMIVSGTEIRTWIFQLLLNPIFQMQFSIKIFSQKGGYWSKKGFFRAVDHLRQSSCKSIEKWSSKGQSDRRKMGIFTGWSTISVHVAAAGLAAFFSGEQCCISSLLGGGPVSFQLLVVLMVKIAGSIMIWLNENWICPHEKKEKPAYIEPEDEV